MVSKYYYDQAHRIKIAASTLLLTIILVPCTTAVAAQYLQARPVHPHPHALRPKRIDPRVAEFNRDVADYKRTVAALRRNAQHLQELQTRLNMLGRELNSINSSTQLDMIHLQSLMSSRQTAVQLSTNLIQSLSKSADSIVQNIGK